MVVQRTRYLFLLCSFMLMAACTLSIPVGQNPTSTYPDLLISMEKRPCFGKCPVYKLTIDGNGDVFYEGEINVAVNGKRNTRINSEQIDALVTAIEKSNFFLLEDKYRVPATDLPSIVLSITLNGHSKSIWHYGTLECNGNLDGAPKELCELENKIEEIVNSDQWVKPN